MNQRRSVEVKSGGGSGVVRVGCGRVDITPEPGLPMVGMPDMPRGEGVLWPLQARVVIVDDGATRVAVVCLDLIDVVTEAVVELRRRVTAAAGVDPAHILVACSHTHRAPFTEANWGGDPADVEPFMERVFAGVETAAARAAGGLREATLSACAVQAPGWAFNRRPIYAGGEVGTHGPARGNGFIGMEDSPDEEIAVLISRGLNGEVLGGLVGFACHPTAMGHDPVYSADYPGVLTETLEARYGGVFGFLLGAAGDTSTPDPTSHDPESGFGPAHTRAMGEALAARAAEVIATARTVAGNPIRVSATRLRIAQRRPTPEQVELARWYLEERPPDLDELAFTRRLYGHDYTFNDGKQVGNERHARELVSMWEWQRTKSDEELIEDIEMQVIAIGDVVIVAFPVELFTAFGRRVKEASTFSLTFIATLANGWHGYAPTLEAFSRGGYEPRFAYPSRLDPSAGDRMTDAALALLQEVAVG